MDYNDIYESYDSELVHLPNSDTYMFANRSYSDIIRDYTAVARQYVNDDYADSLERFMNSIVEQSDTDCEFCECNPEASLMSDMYPVTALGMEPEDIKKMKRRPFQSIQQKHSLTVLLG